MSNFLLNAAAPQGSPWGSLILMIIMFGVMYLLLFLPQKKQQKRDAAMRNALDIGDEVITSGGILGRVVSIKDNTIVIESTSDRTKIRLLKSAIVANNTPHEAPAPVDDKAAKKAAKEEAKAAKKAAKEEAPAEEVKEDK